MFAKIAPRLLKPNLPFNVIKPTMALYNNASFKFSEVNNNAANSAANYYVRN